MARSTGTEEAESPPADLDEERSKLPDAPAAPEREAPLEESAPPADRESEEIEATEEAPPKPKAPKKPDLKPSVQAAIDKLAAPEPKDEVEARPAKPAAAKAAAKPASEAKPEPKAPEKTEDKDEDAFEGFSPDEAKQLKGKTRDRIQSLHARARTAETTIAEREKAIAELKPAADNFKAFDSLIESAGIREDLDSTPAEEFTAAIATTAAYARVDAAIKRGEQPSEQDVKKLQQLHHTVDSILQPLGRGKRGVEPFEGKLPDELNDRVATGEISIAEARILASHAKAASAKPVELRAAAPRQAPPAQRQPQAPVPTVKRALDEVSVADRQIVSLISESGVAPKDVANHFRTNLSPIIDRLVKKDLGSDVKVTDVPPSMRADYARRAQAEFQAKSSNPPRTAAATTAPAQREPTPLAHGNRQTRSSVAKGGSHSDEFLSSVIDHMSAD